MLEIHAPCPVLPVCPRLVQSPTLTLIRTRDQTRIPLLPGPALIHPDPRVHVQGLALARPTVKRDGEGAFRRQIVVIVDVEGRIGEDVTRVKIHPTTTGGDDSLRAVRGLGRQVTFYVDYPRFVS